MWLATSYATAAVGVDGQFWIINPPTKAVFGGSDGATVAYEVTLPYRCNMTTQRSAFASWTRGGQSRKYICGSATDNLVLTEHLTLARLGIQPPSGPLTNTAAPVENQIGYQAIAGGITGNIIPYLRFYDSLNGRRSPLSGPGAVVALANQGLSFSNVPNGPDSPDVGVTHVEVWVSQDGGLPRFWFRRDIGAPTFSGNVTSLGEAETETTSLLPRCKYNAMYHDRYVLAGDDRHPDRVYFSVSEDPENYGGLYISTRQGEPVIGLAVVRDTLIVQCPTIHYYVQGYDENDITMNVLEPNIGGLGHHTMSPWNDDIVIPATLGWYLCNGTSMRPIGEGLFDETWRRTLSLNSYGTTYNIISGARDISDWWATTDLVSGLVKLNVRGAKVSIPLFWDDTTDLYGPHTCWILDLRGGNPSLTFDTYEKDMTAGAQLSKPGYSGTQSYICHSGILYRENEATKADGFDGEAPITIHHLIHTGHQVAVDPIDDSDCVRFQKAFSVISNEYVPVVFDIFAGNEYSWSARTPNDTLSFAAQLSSREVPPDQPICTATGYLVANDRKCMPLNKSAGSAVSMRITCENDGFTVNDQISDSNNLIYSAFLFKGWGADFSGDGEQFRPVSYAIQDCP